MASPQTIQPSMSDTYLSVSSPTTNYATSTALLTSPNSGVEYNSILKFDFSAVVPSGAHITLATLGLYCYAALASRTITAYRLLRADWVEAEATWNIYKGDKTEVGDHSHWGTAGALGLGVDFTTTDAATADSVAVGQWLNETVTAQVQTALDSVSGVAYFLLADVGGSVVGNNGYRSREYATAGNRPKLYIEHTEPSPGAQMSCRSKFW